MLKTPKLSTVTLTQFAVLLLLFIATVTGAAVVPTATPKLVCAHALSIFTWDWLQIWVAAAAGGFIAAFTNVQSMDDKFLYPRPTKAFIGLCVGIATIAGAVGADAVPTNLHIPFALATSALGGLLFGLTLGFLDNQKRFNQIVGSGLSKAPVVGKYIKDTSDLDDGGSDEHSRHN